MDFQQLFLMGMKRELPPLLPRREQEIDVGGNTVCPKSQFTRAAGWNAEEGLKGIQPASINTIHCYHFLEHLKGDCAVKMLREFERVLKVGGAANIVTPYPGSVLAAQDLDHKSLWNEETWKNTFQNTYYTDYGQWNLRVRFCLIAGVVNRNLALFTQLEKT